MTMNQSVRKTARAERAGLASRLGSALDGLLDRWSPSREMICGDADSSLMAIGRDIQTEASLFYGRRRAA